MNLSLDADFCVDLVYCFGHFLWQASVVWIVFVLAMRGLQDHSPGVRYRVGMMSLFAIVGCVVVTYLAIRGHEAVENTVSLTFQSASVEPVDVPAVLADAPDSSPFSAEPPRGSSDRPISDGSYRPWSIARIAPSIVVVYISCVGLLLLRLAFDFGSTVRYRRNSDPVSQPDIKQLVAAVSQRLGLAMAPPVRWSSRVAVPSVIGVVRPVIYLPLACLTGLTSEQLRHVIMHEMAHIRRLDPIFSLLQNAIESLLFFHPAVWFISRHIRLERESCCDAIAAQDAESAAEYASTLLEVASWSRGRVGPTASIAATGDASQLKLRIHRLLGMKSPSPLRRIEGGSLALVALALVLFVIAAAGPSVNADPAPEKPVETASETRKTEPPVPIKLEATPERIVGEVVDADMKPLEGVLVDAWTWWKGTETVTDAQGRFVLNPKTEPRRRAELRFSKPGYSPQYIVQQAVGAEPIRIVLDSKTYFEGVVTDSRGQPVAGAAIRGVQAPKQADGVLIGGVDTSTVADENGRYRLYVFPDTYDLRVSAANRGVARLSETRIATGEAKTLDIKLADGVRFEAQVIDSITSEPVEGFVLWSWREQSVFGKSDNAGKVVIDNLLPGKFDFNIGGGEPTKHEALAIDLYHHGPFGRWWSADAVNEWERKSIEPGKFQGNFDNVQFDLAVGMNPVTIVVERGVSFSGKVVDPDGKPVAGATVAPAKTGSGNSLTGDTRYSVETEADGSYQVVMPAGNDFQYNLIAHDGKYQEWRNWANGTTDVLTTRPGDEIKIDISLNRPCTVRGTVTANGNGDRSKLQVRAHSVDRKENRYYDPTTRTDENGNFELKFVRPGKQFIQVEPFWLDADEAPNPSTVVVDLKEGETREGISLQTSGGR